MANNLAAFNSEAWALRLVTKVDQINLMLPLCNRNWEGDLRQNKTVNIRTPGNIVMSDYTKGQTIDYQDLVPLKEQFTVLAAKYLAFEVDDVDKAQSDIDAMDAYLARAIVEMNNTVERKILSAANPASGFLAGYNQVTAGSSFTAPSSGIGSGALLTAVLTGDKVTSVTVGASGGTGYTTGNVNIAFLPAADGSGYGWGAQATATVVSGAITAVTVTNGGYGYQVAPAVAAYDASPITLTSDTAASLSGVTGVYEQILKAQLILDTNNVDRDGRFLIVDPLVKTLIQNDTAHFVRYGDMGDRIVQTAMIGSQKVERSASEAKGYCGEIAGFGVYATPHVPVDSSGNKYMVFGNPEAISYASQITEMEHLRLQTTFAWAVRALLLHDVFVPAESSKQLGTIKVAASQ